MLEIASVTEKLVTFAVNVVGDLGLAGIFVLMLMESACIPVPSEVTMIYAGYLVSQDQMVFWQAMPLVQSMNRMMNLLSDVGGNN